MNRLFSFIMPILMLVFIGCSEEADTPFVSDKPYTLGISAGSAYSGDVTINFAADASEQTLRVRAKDTPWKIEVPADCQSWIEVSPASGSSNANVRIKVKENESFTLDKKCELIITSEAKEYPISRKIIINQVKKSVEFQITDKKGTGDGSGDYEHNFDSSANEFVFQIKSNTSWSIENTNDWIEISQKSGNNDADIAVKIKANESFVRNREGIIIVKSDVPECPTRRHIKIKQSPIVPIFQITDNKGTGDGSGDYEHNFDSSANEFVFQIKSNTSWSIENTNDWIEISQKSGNNDADIAVKIKANESFVRNREGIIIVKSDVPECPTRRHIKIKQSPIVPILECDISKITFDGQGGKYGKAVNVTTNNDYSISLEGCSDWITVTRNGSSFTVEAKALSSNGMRQGRIIVSFVAPELTWKIEKRIDVEQVSSINGHEYVDLGLPSGLLWATCNVGATKPEGYGSYFAWGETAAKSDYSSSTSQTYGKTIAQLKTARIVGSYGKLTAKYDAATANWGSGWRMPTLDECKELVEKCTTEWTTLNGVKGRKVTGPNGNSIFLPASGYYSGTSLYNLGVRGHYWSSTPTGTDNACNLYFNSTNFSTAYYYRYGGRSVRAVTERK